MPSKFDRKVFGARLGAALKAKGLSQSEAARRIGVAPGRMNEYVHGTYLPPFDRISDIVDTLDLDPRIVFPEWTQKALRSVLQEV